MAISLLQTQSVTAAGASPATISMSNTTTGSLIIVGTVYGGGGHGTGIVTSITDSQGNLYTKIFDTDAGGTIANEMSLWYAYNITGGTTPTITINFDSSFSSLSAIAREYSGIATTIDPLEQKLTPTTGTSVTPKTKATAMCASNQLLVCITTDSWGTGQTYTLGGGFSNLTSVANSSSWDIALQDQIITTPSTIIGTITLGNSVGWLAGLASFKAPVSSLKRNVLRPHPFSPGLSR